MRIHLLAISLLFSALLPLSANAGNLGAVRLNLSDGDVQVLLQGSQEWVAAAANLPLDEGDRLWVPENGKAELQVRGGVFVRAHGNTSVDILSITADSVQLYTDRGHIYLNNRKGGIKTIQIDTPHASIRSYDKSVIMLDTEEDGITEISVLKGDAYAENRSGATLVRSGNSLVIRGSDLAELAPLSTPDDWERWNLERDKLLTAWSESSRYLPEELHDYSSDFDNHGHWNFVNTYGYIWVPRAAVSGWAPYTVGRWEWIRGNYVWVSFDPWGWVPGHYGRWAFLPSLGWCWVPPSPGAVYWGPGFVGWITTPTYVAWVPLAPGEIYYGYGQFGPNSTNIATLSINATLLNRPYRNAHVNNAVMVVQRESFGTNRHHALKMEENPFLQKHLGQDTGSISIMPPSPNLPRSNARTPNASRYEGERHSHGLVETQVTPQKHPTAPDRQEKNPQPVRQLVPPHTVENTLPPKRVRNTMLENIKVERKLVKERGESVFKQQPPDNLPVRQLTEPRRDNKRPAQQQAGERKERH